ncbi:hypothetical protein B0A49_00196 [Cryomyces minteri]|uniref:F-box domain-containing protein n=1 Tax=Cryomyces minteri TaxID=331657 RepID=A0A4U0Y1C2_9PEZI|nr:hypothetical protein B0A49_00196 [Cryomyces minteri]
MTATTSMEYELAFRGLFARTVEVNITRMAVSSEPPLEPLLPSGCRLAASNPTIEQQCNHLMYELPAELRAKILEHILASGRSVSCKHFFVHEELLLAPLRACRALRVEAIPIFFNTRVFQFKARERFSLDSYNHGGTTIPEKTILLPPIYVRPYIRNIELLLSVPKNTWASYNVHGRNCADLNEHWLDPLILLSNLGFVSLRTVRVEMRAAEHWNKPDNEHCTSSTATKERRVERRAFFVDFVTGFLRETRIRAKVFKIVRMKDKEVAKAFEDAVVCYQ